MYTTENKDKLIGILKNDIELDTKEIVAYLGITESTYTKMVSSVNRDLPKKSQIYLEHFYGTKDWDELLKRIKENPKKAKTLIQMYDFRKNSNPDIYIKNFGMMKAFMESEKLQRLEEDELNVLKKMFESEKLYEGIKQKIRLYRFFTTGDASFLEEKDIMFIGAHSIMNKQEDKEVMNELKTQGQEVIEKIKIKFEDNSVI